MKRLMILLCLLLLVSSCALALGDSGEDNIRYAVVNNPDPADRLNLRTKPSTDAISLGKFYNGTPVAVLSTQGDWAYVSLYQDFEGWMHTDYLAFPDNIWEIPSAMPVVTVTAPGGKTVHDTMMESPSVSVPFTMGSQLEVMGVMEDWLFVRAGESIAGFTSNSGVMPRVYFSSPDATPPMRASLIATPVPTPAYTSDYELLSVPVEGARNVSEDEWINFAAITAATPLFADRALTKPIAILPRGHFTRVLNSVTSFATVIEDHRIAGYIPRDSFSIHAAHWPFSVDQPSAMVANPILSDRLHLRKKPDTNARSLGRYYNGTVVTLLDNFSGGNEWTHVDIGGVQGYMMSRYLDFSPAPNEHHPCLSLFEVHNPYAGTLHLRTQPDTIADSLGLFENGTLVAIIGFSGQWAHVICGGETGFMMHQYLRTSIGTSFDPYQ